MKGSDIDLPIVLGALMEVKNRGEKTRVWHEFENWVIPLSEEFKNKYGIKIDLRW